MSFDSETVVQSVVVNALVKWFHDKNVSYRGFPPANRSQGDDVNEYAGDLIGLIQNCKVLLLELKAKHPQTDMLQSWKPDQFARNVALWDLALPIRYAYATEPRLSDWEANEVAPDLILQAVNQTPPRLLKDQHADVKKHGSLRDHLLELMRKDGSVSVAEFARISGGAVAIDELRNGILLMLYSKKSRAWRLLNADNLKTFFVWVRARRKGLALSAYDEKAGELLQSQRSAENVLAELDNESINGFDLAFTVDTALEDVPRPRAPWIDPEDNAGADATPTSSPRPRPRPPRP